jgi:dihydrofolate reductase
MFYTPRISLIAALGATTRAIGAQGALLWHIPEDLAHFKRITLTHPVIMGQATFESIGRPLPKRENIVLSHDPTYAPEGVHVAHSLEEALTYARTRDSEEIVVIGGGTVYTQTIDSADRLYLTLVESETPGDTYFPPYEHLPFKKVEEHHSSTADMRYTFVTLDRITPTKDGPL